MLIRIMYRDGRFDMVKSFFLEWLIESGRIAMFRRSQGWVVPGRDPVRRVGDHPYRGIEQRRKAEPPPIALMAMRFSEENRERQAKTSRFDSTQASEQSGTAAGFQRPG